MPPKHKLRKIYTEPDPLDRLDPPDDNLMKTNNINIKDLELNINDVGRNISDSKKNHNIMYKNTHFYIPNKFNKMNRKQLIKKLPDINLTSVNTLSRPIKMNQINQTASQTMNSNKKNTFLLNSLFEILKPRQQQNFQGQINRSQDLNYGNYHRFNYDYPLIKISSGQKKNISIDPYYQNEFINVKNNNQSISTKNRGPKIIQNQITRLSNHNNVLRRKIVSEQKSRPKYTDKSIQKLKQTTFQHFKRVHYGRQQQSQYLQAQRDTQKESFQNLQIITFYNKFPGRKDREDNKPSLPKSETNIGKQLTNKPILLDRPPLPAARRNRIKTELIPPVYMQEQQNQFIFDK